MKTFIRTVTETRHYVETVTSHSTSAKYVERDAIGRGARKRHLAATPVVCEVEPWREATQIELALLGKVVNVNDEGDDCDA